MKKSRTRKTTRGFDVRPPDDIEGFLESLGITVDPDRSYPGNVMALCPQHEARKGRPDLHASWSINATTGLHVCFSCDYTGNIVRLVSDVRGCGYFEALRHLKAFGVDLRKIEKLPGYDPEVVVPESAEIGEYRLSKFTTEIPEKALKQRLIKPWAAAHYGIRWATLGRKWVLPIRTLQGALLGYQLKRGHVVRNMPVGVRKSETLFGIDKFPPGETAVLVESPLDVARLQTIGVDGGLAAFGARVSDTQMRLLLDVTDDLIVALDNDEAGWAQAKRLRDEWSKRFNMRFFEYVGDGKDIGEMRRAEIEFGLKRAKHSTLVRL